MKPSSSNIEYLLNRLESNGRVPAISNVNVPNFVAKHLRDNKYMGVPGNCRACPVAVFLQSNLDTIPRNLLVSPELVQWTDDQGRVKHLVLPVALSQFVTNFDNKLYPDLIGYPSFEKDSGL